jgi:glycosyltransferase involved in cell wall biosynthesis
MTKKIILSANTDWFLYNFRFTLAKFLRDQGYRVVLISPPGKYTSYFKEQGFPWLRWDVGRQSIQPWREMGSLIQLAKIYRQEKPDLVHHHTIKPVIYGSMVARMAGINNVVNSITGRGYVFLGKDTKAHSLKRIISPLYRFALNNSNYAVIFENSIDQQYFIENDFVPAKRTWLIGGVGVDVKKFTLTPEPEGIPVILFSGRMLWDKGVGVLVQAARLLHKKTEVRVVLAGEPDSGNPASIAKEQLETWENEGVVEWWGWQADMSKVYAQCHIVTLPTMYGEGIPTVLLEAAATGRPTVATDIPGCRAITIDGETGFIVPENNPHELAGALLKLISDPVLRKDMGAKAHQLVLEKFTTERVNEETLNVYRTVLGESS